MPHLFSSCCCSALLSPLVSGISHQPPPTHLSHRCGCRPAVAEHDEYYADLINKAVEGAGTDEKLLARVIVSRRHLLPGINKAFMHKYEKTIQVRAAPLGHPPLLTARSPRPPSDTLMQSPLALHMCILPGLHGPPVSSLSRCLILNG